MAISADAQAQKAGGGTDIFGRQPLAPDGALIVWRRLENAMQMSVGIAIGWRGAHV
jgi:hypothetical protein